MRNIDCDAYVFRTEHSFIEAFAAAVSVLFSAALTLSTVLLWMATERLASGAEAQSKEMKESINQATRAADAMQGVSEAMTANAVATKILADATMISAAAAERTSYADRPWLFVVEAKNTQLQYRQARNWDSIISFKIRNAGRMPAILTMVSIRVWYFPRWQDPNEQTEYGQRRLEGWVFGSLSEEETHRMLPVENNGRQTPGDADLVISASSATQELKFTGSFTHIESVGPETPPPEVNVRREMGTGKLFCWIIVRYRDLHGNDRESGYYARLSHFHPAMEVDDEDGRARNYFR